MIVFECPFCEDEFEIHERYLTEDLDSVVCPICEAEVQLDEFWKEYKEYRAARKGIVGKKEMGKYQRLGFRERFKSLRHGLKHPEQTAKTLSYYLRQGVTPEHLSDKYKKTMLSAAHKAKRGGQLERAAKGRLKRMRGEFWRGQREALKGKLKDIVRRIAGRKAAEPKAGVSPEKETVRKQPGFKPKALLTAG